MITKSKQPNLIILLIMMSYMMPPDSFFAQVSSSEHWKIKEINTGKNNEILSNIEKEIIAEINMVRTQPRLYAEKYIKPLLPFYQGVYFRHPGQIPVVTSEGKAALVDCIEALQESEPCGIIHPSNGLTFAAQKHLKDQSKSGDLGHIGADGSSPFERMSNYGEWQHLAVENIDYGNNSPREIVISLLIDDGVPGRGHRKNILNKELNFIGVAFGSHPNYGHMCVMDLAGGFMEN